MSNLLDLDRKNIWHPFSPLIGAEEPLLITSAKGIYLHTHDGRDIIDAVSSWWVNLHGHANAEIAQAIATQASTLEHVIFAGFTHQPAIELSKNLLQILPDNQRKIFFSDNGSTAVEVALKMAIQYWSNQGNTKKNKVIAIRGAYHGDTFGSMSVGDRGLFTAPFSDYLFDTDFIDFPEKGQEEKTLEQFKRLIQTGDVAAFIFEPLIQAAAGMRMYQPETLDSLINLAQQHNIICIADEVFTGFGRTGKLFASDHLQFKPDIIALSKGLTGGAMPLGVTSCSNKILKAFETAEFSQTFFHGHSYTANPLSCAAANASFTLLMKDECQQQIKNIGLWQMRFMEKHRNNKKFKDIRSLGTILAIELQNTETTSYSNSIRKRIYSFFLKRNILLRPLGNVIYIVPPYIISDVELTSVHSAIETFVDELQ
jgi:adenosylmethionine---8-amino-7-oxononanoate aminotransferase